MMEVYIIHPMMEVYIIHSIMGVYIIHPIMGMYIIYLRLDITTSFGAHMITPFEGTYDNSI